MNDLEKAFLVHMCERALKDGCVISIDSLVKESRDIPEIIAAVESVNGEVSIDFHNNIGRNWVGSFSVEDMYMGVNGRYVSDYSWSTCPNQQERIKAIVGESA